MNNIIEFNNKKEFIEYIKPLLKEDLNSGSEGDIYITKDNNVIKVMHQFFGPKYLKDCPDIIMSNDLKLDSYIFPDELYIIDGIIMGYKEKLFENDVFSFYPSLKKFATNIDNLFEAREKFIEDTIKLTEYGYKLFELPRNIMYDNKRIVAIDTLDYIKQKVKKEENIRIVDHAILLELSDMYKEIDVRQPFDTEIKKLYKRN